MFKTELTSILKENFLWHKSVYFCFKEQKYYWQSPQAGKKSMVGEENFFSKIDFLPQLPL